MEPKEFWIEHKLFIDEWVYEAYTSDEARTNRDITPIHVIEYSAYKKLQDELIVMEAKEFLLRVKVDKLTEQNKIMREALDTEEYEGTIGANESQGGEFNAGATAALKNVIDINKEALAACDLKDGDK